MGNWLSTAAAALALAVILGAFGAHSLRDRLDAYLLGVYEKAVFYHFIHALGMLIVAASGRAGLLAPSAANRICWTFAAGIVLFSGSLYLLATTGLRQLGAVTPFGGAAFICAWISLAYAARR